MQSNHSSLTSENNSSSNNQYIPKIVINMQHDDINGVISFIENNKQKIKMITLEDIHCEGESFILFKNLLNIIGYCTQIKLFLSGNQIHLDGAQGGNKHEILDETAAMSLFKALEINHTVESLILYNINIPTNTINQLKQTLINNKTLTSFYYMGMGHAGHQTFPDQNLITAITEATSVNKNLCDVSFNVTDFSQKSLEPLIHAAKSNRLLKQNRRALDEAVKRQDIVTMISLYNYFNPIDDRRYFEQLIQCLVDVDKRYNYRIHPDIIKLILILVSCGRVKFPGTLRGQYCDQYWQHLHQITEGSLSHLLSYPVCTLSMLKDMDNRGESFKEDTIILLLEALLLYPDISKINPEIESQVLCMFKKDNALMIKNFVNSEQYYCYQSEITAVKRLLFSIVSYQAIHQARNSAHSSITVTLKRKTENTALNLDSCKKNKVIQISSASSVLFHKPEHSSAFQSVQQTSAPTPTATLMKN
jgi:hypothetical protein